jgi:hypothetical protein
MMSDTQSMVYEDGHERSIDKNSEWRITAIFVLATDYHCYARESADRHRLEVIYNVC